jgi:hypothetical protein
VDREALVVVPPVVEAAEVPLQVVVEVPPQVVEVAACR